MPGSLWALHLISMLPGRCKEQTQNQHARRVLALSMESRVRAGEPGASVTKPLSAETVPYSLEAPR